MRLSGSSERGCRRRGRRRARAVLAASPQDGEKSGVKTRFDCLAILLLHGPTLGSREARDQRERQRAAAQEQQRRGWEQQPSRVQEQ